jgi:hypothetical protein
MITMEANTLTPAEQADHDRSVHDYPELDLGDDEYVVTSVARSVVGLVFIWLTVTLVAGVFGVLALIVMTSGQFGASREMMAAACLLGVVVALLVGLLVHWTYRRNYLIVSNQRVFERMQSTPFSYRMQSLEIEHIEDVSFTQEGILPTLFNYGSVRMSTVGDEQTYQLTFVANVAEQIKIIKKVVHAVDEQEPTKYRKQ